MLNFVTSPPKNYKISSAFSYNFISALTKMKNTLEILDNYLERAVAENLNIVDVLDHIFAEEAKGLEEPRRGRYLHCLYG